MLAVFHIERVAGREVRILKSYNGLKWVCESRILRLEKRGPLNTSVSRIGGRRGILNIEYRT